MQYHNHLENHKTGLTAEGKQAYLATLEKCTPLGACGTTFPPMGDCSDGANNGIEYQ